MEKLYKQRELLSNKAARFFLISFCVLSSNLSTAQVGNRIDFNVKIGLIIEYGTHVHRLGMLVSTATNFAATQLNAELRGFYNFKTFGPPQKGVETVWSLGLAQGFGRKYTLDYGLVDDHFFKTNRNYTLGYTFRKYHDRMETTQGTGSIFFAAKSFILNFENDLLGNTHGRDRFRTGGFSLNYIHDRWLFSLKNIIWTGETRCAEKISYIDTEYPSRYGYHDITKCKYGNFSNGIAAAGIIYLPEDGFGQFLNFSIGLDHEKIRHFFQNKLIHDMYFMPDGINPSKNLHYPMLDVEGNAYLFTKEQILKKPKLYMQVGANGHWLY